MGVRSRRLVVDGRDVAEPVERERPVAEHLEPLGAAAAVQRPDAGQQLVEAERLRQIVVGAGVEAADHVLDRVARGEHQDGRVPPLPPELGRDLEPVLLGQHDVEQDDVVLVDVGQHGGLVAVGGDVHHVALFLQSLLDESGDLPVVFHDENFHGPQSSGGRLNAAGTLREGFFMIWAWPAAPARTGRPGPGRDTARSSPPSRRASRRERGRPSPAPRLSPAALVT